ncbi:uncharacterized protein CCR75_005156 [Bremia lactucae]|uniref:Uncharacterized protein n=1 Tax=Bremia lactucae TaxID=4779 RepID=A0A976ICH3_BRELC|nr:hypothetical protein CCR75_005156 [Bremia lactucae]
MQLQQKQDHESVTSDGIPKLRRAYERKRVLAQLPEERLKLEKVIEKLRAENDKLQKAANRQALLYPERVNKMRRKLNEHNEAGVEAQLKSV